MRSITHVISVPLTDTSLFEMTDTVLKGNPFRQLTDYEHVP